jgi:Domain of unknown function (DUF4440)
MNAPRKTRSSFPIASALLAALLMPAPPSFATGDDDSASSGLRREILALDARITDAYDRCAVNALKAMFAPHAELYFAGRGSTKHLFEHTDALRREFCGKYRREVSAEEQEVYALPGINGIDGAIQIGTQSFCEIDADACKGLRMRFVAVWKRIGEEWKILRLLRYEYETLR